MPGECPPPPAVTVLSPTQPRLLLLCIRWAWWALLHLQDPAELPQIPAAATAPSGTSWFCSEGFLGSGGGSGWRGSSVLRSQCWACRGGREGGDVMGARGGRGVPTSALIWLSLQAGRGAAGAAEGDRQRRGGG